jgi:hypothetical protein
MTRFAGENRITDSTLGQGTSSRTLAGKQSVTEFGVPKRFLTRNIRIPVMAETHLSALPTFGPVDERGSFFDIFALLRTLLRKEEVACFRRACTFVRESPTRFHPTVPQKLHGSADCLPFTDVLSFVKWAEILRTSNPARNAATALPARLVAVGNYLGPLAEVRKRPASPFPSIQNSDDETALRVGTRAKSQTSCLLRNSPLCAAAVSLLTNKVNGGS